MLISVCKFLPLLFLTPSTILLPQCWDLWWAAWMPITVIIHLERNRISFSGLAHYEGEAPGGQAGNESVYSYFFSSTRGRGRMWVVFLLLLALGCLPLDWPPFPDVVIVLQPSRGPPSAGRHFSSGRSVLNSCWEQLGLCDCCQWETKR